MIRLLKTFAATMLLTPLLSISGDNSTMSDATFSLNFKVENIKILPGTYDVVMSKKLLSRFVSRDYNLKYYIALEPASTFE